MRKQLVSLAALKCVVSSLEGRNDHQLMSSPMEDDARLTFGEGLLDEHLEGGLAKDCMHEIRCEQTRDVGAAMAFLCAFLSRNHKQGDKLFWIVDPSASVDAGIVCPDGLHQLGLEPADIVFVHPRDLKMAIWATGEAARQGGLSAIIFQVQGNPKMLDLAVSRKLMLRAQTSRTPLFILRQGGAEEASSAATRWRVSPLSSQKIETQKWGIGPMRYRLTLERNRTGQTGTWPVSWHSSERIFSHAAITVPPTRHRNTVSSSRDRSDIKKSLGQVMAFERAS